MSRNLPHVSDWLSRVTIPDMYPRLDDPFSPRPAITPGEAPPISIDGGPSTIQQLFQLTAQAARPYAYQLAMNYTLTVGTTPVPLLRQSFAVDTIVIDNLSTALNSVFFGFGNQTNTTSGLEIQSGVPLTLRADNTREMWEIQRTMEFIAGMMAMDRGMGTLGTYRAPRVVFDASAYSLVAAASTNVAVMLFYIPEGQ